MTYMTQLEMTRSTFDHANASEFDVYISRFCFNKKPALQLATSWLARHFIHFQNYLLPLDYAPFAC